MEKYDQAATVQLASRSGMPRCVCRLANIDEQILPLPFSGLATETCQYQGAGVIVALQRDVLSVNRPALKSPGLSAETCQHWSGRHLARIGTIPFKEGQGGSMCTTDPGGGSVEFETS